jgi:hypothetical protein
VGRQHRFIETSFLSLAAGPAQIIAAAFGYGSAAEVVRSIAKDFIADYLHTF